MRNPFEDAEIWFLTGSQDLYGEETLRQVAEQSRSLVARLDESAEIPVRVLWKPTLTDRDAIRRAMLEANSSDACVGVIAWMHTFSPAKMWIPGLAALTKPLLHLHTQAAMELPWASIDMDYMNLNQAAHGDREFGYAATRLGIRRTVAVGHVADPATRGKVGDWARAATAAAELRGLRLARFGDNMRNVAVTDGDKTEVELRMGVSVTTWAVNELVEAVRSVSDAEAEALCEDYHRAYQLAPELAPAGERRASLIEGARIECGLRHFLAQGDFGAFTTNFEDLGGLAQLPGLAVQRLMADGYGFGAEGDWKTAILVRAAKVMGYGLAGGASLMEDYCYELSPGRQKILGAHMLEVCPSLTESTPRLEVHPLAIGNRADPVRLVFEADPGPGIVVSLIDLGPRLRLTANVVDLVPADAPLPRLPVAHAVWQPRPDLATSAECWITAGGAHHTVLSSATGLPLWEALAGMLDLELAVIDEHTSPRGFAAALRWEDAHRRLGGN